MARGATPLHQVRVIMSVVLTQKTNVGIQARKLIFISSRIQVFFLMSNDSYLNGPGLIPSEEGACASLSGFTLISFRWSVSGPITQHWQLTSRNNYKMFRSWRFKSSRPSNTNFLE
jgi:hypothetical protein